MDDGRPIDVQARERPGDADVARRLMAFKAAKSIVAVHLGEEPAWNDDVFEALAQFGVTDRQVAYGTAETLLIAVMQASIGKG